MERLTQYFECGAYVDRSNIVNISELAEQFFEKGAYMGKAIDKLAEFEDFMEEMDFQDLGTFRMAIKLSQAMNNNGIKYFKENQELKDRWQKLKEFIDIQLNDYRFEGHIVSPETQELNYVLNKMQELEKEGSE